MRPLHLRKKAGKIMATDQPSGAMAKTVDLRRQRKKDSLAIKNSVKLSSNVLAGSARPSSQ